MAWSRIHHWGSTAEERAASWPCDVHLPGADVVLFRALDVDAPAAVLFRWLCQLRAAPYSYDWIDNLGRRSPRTLTTGLDALEAGQRVMTIFRLVDFRRGEHLTLLSDGALFGRVAVTYRVTPRGEGRARLAVKLLAHGGGGLRGALVRRLLPLGDWIMMRKQLLTLRALAERDARRPPEGRRGSTPPPGAPARRGARGA